MMDAHTRRKRLFRSALGITGMTAQQWATKHGVTDGHLSHVLAGHRDGSPELAKQIDEFIRRHCISMAAIAS